MMYALYVVILLLTRYRLAVTSEKFLWSRWIGVQKILVDKLWLIQKFMIEIRSFVDSDIYEGLHTT